MTDIFDTLAEAQEELFETEKARKKAEMKVLELLRDMSEALGAETGTPEATA